MRGIISLLFLALLIKAADLPAGVKKMPDGTAVTALPYDGAGRSCRLSGEYFSFSIGTIDGILLSNHTGRGRLTLRKDGIPFLDSEIRQTSARRLQIQPIESISP